MTSPELTHKGWQRIPTCIQCGYEVFERPEPIVDIHVPGKRHRNPVMPS